MVLWNLSLKWSKLWKDRLIKQRQKVVVVVIVVVAVAVAVAVDVHVTVKLFYLQWLRALPSTRHSFNVLFGECPYCNKVCRLSSYLVR